LDEPTIGLDPVARQTVWDRLHDLNQTYRMTILITTHDMVEADNLCDELALLHRGTVAVTGKSAELKKNLGPDADLNDVFTHYSGSTIQEGGNYRDAHQPRRAASRHS
jgi:ABC-2 type transport system ATP-binding protein